MEKHSDEPNNQKVGWLDEDIKEKCSLLSKYTNPVKQSDAVI